MGRTPASGLVPSSCNPVYQLASIDAFNRPHVRSLIHRAFLTPKSSQSTPLLLTTTDIRTPKVMDFAANSYVELCWWTDPTKEQFRISGRIFVIPSPSHPEYAEIIQKLEGGGKTLRALEAEGIDWETKRKAAFDSMSAHMKASWIRPTPGSTLEGGYEESKRWPTTVGANAGDTPDDPKEAENLKIAFGNFALLLIDPIEVDYVELGILPNRRTRFVRQGGTNGTEWVDELIVP